ncbi:hypothetical protein [Mesorhizobium captivum]|uniref:hypothetical protein n=1 Tax=Mesorhizobium captivum TaxID=3072319 RepID=UPI002A23E6CC|nr:hypothetical protein [Mesorhizobium sp. VK23E]MDX8513571.1 hypothetical protein [Mesorhizobium sp. VK23E]
MSLRHKQAGLTIDLGDRIACSREPGPSRYERRRQHQSAIPSRNLGVIEGEHLRNARGYCEDYELARALASLVAVAAILFCAAVILGAI